MASSPPFEGCTELAADYWTLANDPNASPDDVEDARMAWVIGCNDGVAETGGVPTKPPHGG